MKNNNKINLIKIITKEIENFNIYLKKVSNRDLKKIPKYYNIGQESLNYFNDEKK